MDYLWVMDREIPRCVGRQWSSFGLCWAESRRNPCLAFVWVTSCCRWLPVPRRTKWSQCQNSCSCVSFVMLSFNAVSLPSTDVKLSAGELMSRISEFYLDKWQYMLSPVVRVINFILFTRLLALSNNAKMCLALGEYWLTDSELLTIISLTHCVLMIRGTTSILQTSTCSEAHISGMYQHAGHSWKVLHGIFSCRLL